MTKSGLIEAVLARMPNLALKDVEIVINTMFDSMTQALEREERIEIRGFGSFSVRHRRPRTGRNPKTGEEIAVPAKRVPFFTVGHELKERVNGGGASPEATQDAGPGSATADSVAHAPSTDSDLS